MTTNTVHFDNTDQTLDAIGNVVVSNAKPIFESYFEYDSEPRIWDTFTVGTGAFSYSTVTRQCQLSTGGSASGARCVRQTIPYIRFRRGKVLKVNAVFNLNSAGTISGAAKSRAGYYDDGDGLFLQLSSSGLAIVARASGTGSVVDTVIPQSAWNLDKLNGTGPSRITLDSTKGQSFIIAFNSFRTGRIRFGFQLEQRAIFCHEINSLNSTAMAFKRRSLPLRFEVLNDGGVGSNVTANQGGSFVNELGDSTDEACFLSSCSNGITDRTVTNASFLPLLSIRLKDQFGGQDAHAFVIPYLLQILNEGGNNVNFQVLDGSGSSIVLTGASFNSAGVNSQIEFDIAATVISGGDIILSGYSDSGRVNVVNVFGFPYKPTLGRRYSTGERTIVTVAAKSLGGGQLCAAAMTMKEFF